MNLRQIGEDRLLAQITSLLAADQRVLAAAGDDCAVVRPPGNSQYLLLKTDCVVAGIHFSPRAKAGDVGWKAMMRPLSDFAAMAGVPEFALVTLVLPATTTAAWTKQLYRGLENAARQFDVRIVGGETSASRGPAVISVSVTGFVEKNRWITRSGGRSGDALFVTGRLGGSLQGKHLRFLPRIKEARWLAKNFPVHAMMDLSDGLGADLPRLARASKLQFEIEEHAVPITGGCSLGQAINDGEDYELLFAVPSRLQKKLLDAWKKKFPKLLLTRIGRLTQKQGGAPHKNFRGYVHFAQR